MATLQASDALYYYTHADCTGLSPAEAWDLCHADRFNRALINAAQSKQRANIEFVYYKHPSCTALTTLAEVEAALVPLGYTVHSVVFTGAPDYKVTVTLSY